jgi:hypothetical protein
MMGRHDFRVVDLLPHAALLDNLGAAEEIGRLRWTLRQVIALVDDAPTITDEQLRTRLVVLASGAR